MLYTVKQQNMVLLAPASDSKPLQKYTEELVSNEEYTCQRKRYDQEQFDEHASTAVDRVCWCMHNREHFTVWYADPLSFPSYRTEHGVRLCLIDCLTSYQDLSGK